MSENEQAEALAQAVRWRMRLAESKCESTAELRAWLRADPRNADAWRQVQGPWELLGQYAASPEFVRRRQTALAHAHKIGLGDSRLTRSRITAMLGVSAAAVLIIALSGLLWHMYHFDIYRTRAGERRAVTLSDGSEVALDSGSEVRVRYGKHSRELVLLRGQARFNVAHDLLRPFSVSANGHQVIATGTSFNVDLLGPELRVTLIEGHVIVMPQDAPTQPLDAGEQLVLSPRAAPSLTHVNVDHAVAWENGRLVFDNEPMSSVVVRVGRYGGHAIVIADDATSRLRISGVFHEGDVAGFVSTVVSYFSLRADSQPDGSIRLSTEAAPDAR